MRQVFMAAIAAAFLLAGCTPADFYAKVVSGAKEACGILISAATIAAQYPNPTIDSVSTAVTWACNEATQLPATLGRHRMAAHGVTITYTIVDQAKFNAWKATH